MKPTILFDIDYTLVNTDKLRSLVTQELLNVLKVDKAALDQIEREFVTRLEHPHDFDPLNYLAFLTTKFKVSTDKLEKAFFKPSSYELALFDEIKRTLKELKPKFNLGIFSEGVEHFQLAKLSLAKITKFFDNKLVFVFRRKLIPENIHLLPNNAYVVDDNLTVIQTLKEISKTTPILIDRKKSVVNYDYKKINDISELLNI